jgi:hypothetical protein
MVHTKVIFENGTSTEDVSFREQGADKIFTALETASTVSLGRALGNLGIGIDNALPTSDEIADKDTTIPTNNAIQDNLNGLEESIKPKRKRRNVKTVTTASGKDITVDLDSGITEEKVIEAKLSASIGDTEHTQKVVEEIKGDSPKEEDILIKLQIDVPELEEGKRNFNRVDVKTFFIKLQELGATKENITDFVTSEGWLLPANVELTDWANDFIRYATKKEISIYLLYLQTLKTN